MGKPLSLTQLLDRVSVSKIASIRGTVSGILALINAPNSSPKDLKELILVDPPLSAQLLRVANSSYYASPRTISDIDQALIWIGFDALQEIILTQKMSDMFSGGDEFGGYSRIKLWRHSLGVALLAKYIFRREFGKKGKDVYAAGLIHDIGVIIEDQIQHSNFVQAVSDSVDNQLSLVESEKAIFGYEHCMVGKKLAENWNFPAELADGIGFHHNPGEAKNDHNGFVKTIFIADYLMFVHGFGYVDMVLPDVDVFAQYADDLGLKPYALSSLVALVKEEIAKMEKTGYLQV